MTLREYIKEAMKGQAPQQQTALAKGRAKLLAAYPGKSPGEALRAEKKQDKIAKCKAKAGEGRGHGPLGKPLGSRGMTGEERPHKKTAFDLAYEEGVKLALTEYLEKMSQGAGGAGVFDPGGGFGQLTTRGAPVRTMTQPVAGPAAARGPMGGMPGPSPMTLGGGQPLQLPKQRATPAPPMVAGRATGVGSGV